jgi:hypothetical protein
MYFVLPKYSCARHDIRRFLHIQSEAYYTTGLDTHLCQSFLGLVQAVLLHILLMLKRYFELTELGGSLERRRYIEFYNRI